MSNRHVMVVFLSSSGEATSREVNNEVTSTCLSWDYPETTIIFETRRGQTDIGEGNPTMTGIMYQTTRCSPKTSQSWNNLLIIPFLFKYSSLLYFNGSIITSDSTKNKTPQTFTLALTSIHETERDSFSFLSSGLDNPKQINWLLSDRYPHTENIITVSYTSYQFFSSS